MENPLNDKEIEIILEEQMHVLGAILTNLQEEHQAIIGEDTEWMEEILTERISLIQKLHTLREFVPDDYYVGTPLKNPLKELIHQIDVQNRLNQDLLDPIETLL
jgi:hypothetical protein